MTKVNKQQIRRMRSMAKKDIPNLIDKLFDLLETGMDLFAEESQKEKEREEEEGKKEEKQKDKKD